MRRAGGRLRCAGMSAAVTAGHRGLNVLIVEKEPRFGGTTARSGGWLWIPGTSLARNWGIVESPGPGADLSAPRGRQQLRRRARRCVSDRRSRSGRFLHQQNRGALRHAADLSGLSRRSARRRAGRPLDGDAAVRRPRARPAHQESRRPLPELTVFGMMLGSGKEIVHFMRATKSLTSASMSQSGCRSISWT
jgi:glycine/D-amino acid oxidase-like deaminating enzyme